MFEGKTCLFTFFHLNQYEYKIIILNKIEDSEFLAYKNIFFDNFILRIMHLKYTNIC